MTLGLGICGEVDIGVEMIPEKLVPRVHRDRQDK